jgi:hypothetical protein
MHPRAGLTIGLARQMNHNATFPLLVAVHAGALTIMAE